MRIRFLALLPAVALGTAALGAGPNEVPKEDWIKAMKTALPTAFCKPGMFFRECFKVSQQECEQTALSATRVCLENLKDDIPAALKMPQDGSQWGSKVGTCAGSAYEVTLADKKTRSKKCNDPSQWVPK